MEECNLWYSAQDKVSSRYVTEVIFSKWFYVKYFEGQSH